LFNTWDDEEVRHFFVPRKDVIYTYVVETGDKITDVVSFYSLPSSVLKHEKHTELRAAYSYYHANTTVSLEVKMVNEVTV
jgi:glycylpeptide N-tetradecanoyltransferase